MIKYFLSTVVFLLSMPLWAQEVVVHKEVLPNGLTVLIQPMSISNSVSFIGFVKAGSVNESDCMGCGVSHIVEHMVFKGTQKRGVGVIPQEVKQLGGVINAHTSFEETVYKLDLPKDKWREGLDIIHDMLNNAIIDEKELQKELEVIRGEMRLYRDRPERQLSELVFATAYLQHSYRHPIIGYQNIFDQVTRQQVYDYYKQFYVPNNIILSVAGDINVDELMKAIKNQFGGISARPIPVTVVNQEPDVLAPRIVKQPYKGQMYYVSYSFPTIPLLHRDLYALDLLAMILSSGYQAPLHDILYKKKQLVKSVSASSFTPKDKGVFEFEMTMEQDHVNEALTIIHQLLNDISVKGVGKKYFDAVKKDAVIQFRSSSQRASQLSIRNAQDEAIANDPQFSKQYMLGLQSVTISDIKRVIKTYFHPSRSVLVLLYPEEDKVINTKGIKSSMADHKIPQTFTLSNGIKVAIVTTPDIELFHVTAILRGGLREETLNNNGLSRVFANTWTFASKKWPKDQLASFLDSQRLKLSAFNGYNSFGLTVSGLSEDMITGLEVLADVLINPIFDAKDLERKRSDALSSHKSRQDNITALSYRTIFKNFYGDHPYGLDELGTIDVINKISLDDLRQYHQRFVNPENLIITIAGNVTPLEVINALERLIGKWQKFDMSNLRQISYESFNKQISDEILMNKEQALVAYAFNAPSLHSQDKWSMEIIDTVLGSGLGGRIYNKVREQFGSAYTMGINYIPGIDTGIFIVHVQTKEEDVNKVSDLIVHEIEQIVRLGISKEELDVAKTSILGRQQIGLDTPTALSWEMATDGIYGFGFDNYLKLKEHLESVTIDDVRRVAGQYLNLSQTFKLVTKPKN